MCTHAQRHQVTAAARLVVLSLWGFIAERGATSKSGRTLSATALRKGAACDLGDSNPHGPMSL
eukprot:197690-Amphidinium_carterae.1